MIGSNKGLRARDFIEVIIKNSNVPVIIDAGIGRPSQAAEAMEIQPWISPREIPVFMISQIARVSHSAGILVLPSASA